MSYRHAAYLLACCISSIGLCQVLPVDATTGRITYSGVIPVDSVTADELYSRAILWYTQTFKSAKAAMELSDRATGVIVSDPDANFPAYFVKKNGTRVADGWVTFSLKIQCKDGRFKYTLTNLEHKGGSCPGGVLEKESTMCFWKNLWTSLKDEANTSATALIQSLSKSMASRAAADGGDW